jgi:hypothetical protein
VKREKNENKLIKIKITVSFLIFKIYKTIVIKNETDECKLII